MENKNSLQEILEKITDVLNEYNCKSEIKSADQESILYGKFLIGNIKHTVVVHIQSEEYQPKRRDAGRIMISKDQIEKEKLPSLDMNINTTRSANCSEEENFILRDKYISEINRVVLKEYKTGDDKIE